MARLLRDVGLSPAMVDALDQHHRARTPASIVADTNISDEDALAELQKRRRTVVSALGVKHAVIANALGVPPTDIVLTDADFAGAEGIRLAGYVRTAARHELAAALNNESAASTTLSHAEAAGKAREKAAAALTQVVSSAPTEDLVDTPSTQAAAAASTYLAVTALCDLVVAIHQRTPNGCLNNAVTVRRVLYSNTPNLPDEMPPYTPMSGHDDTDINNASGGGMLQEWDNVDQLAAFLATEPHSSAWLYIQRSNTEAAPSDNDREYARKQLDGYHTAKHLSHADHAARLESVKKATKIAQLISALSDLPELEEHTPPWFFGHVITLYNKGDHPHQPELVVIDIAAGPEHLKTTPEDLTNPTTLLNTATDFETWKSNTQLNNTDYPPLATTFDGRGRAHHHSPQKQAPQHRNRYALAGHRPPNDALESAGTRSYELSRRRIIHPKIMSELVTHEDEGNPRTLRRTYRILGQAVGDWTNAQIGRALGAPINEAVWTNKSRIGRALGAPMNEAVSNPEYPVLEWDLPPRWPRNDPRAADMLGLFEAITGKTSPFADVFVKYVDGRRVWQDHHLSRQDIIDIGDRVTRLQGNLQQQSDVVPFGPEVLAAHVMAMFGLREIARHADDAERRAEHLRRTAGLDDDDDSKAKARLIEEFRLKHPYIELLDSPHIPANAIGEILNTLDELLEKYRYAPGLQLLTNIRRVEIDFPPVEQLGVANLPPVDRGGADHGVSNGMELRFDLRHVADWEKSRVQHALRRERGTHPSSGNLYKDLVYHEFARAIDQASGHDLSRNLLTVLRRTHAELQQHRVVTENFDDWCKPLGSDAFTTSEEPELDPEKALGAGFAGANFRRNPDNTIVFGTSLWAIHEYVTTGVDPNVELRLSTKVPDEYLPDGLIGTPPAETIDDGRGAHSSATSPLPGEDRASVGQPGVLDRQVVTSNDTPGWAESIAHVGAEMEALSSAAYESLPSSIADLVGELPQSSFLPYDETSGLIDSLPSYIMKLVFARILGRALLQTQVVLTSHEESTRFLHEYADMRPIMENGRPSAMTLGQSAGLFFYRYVNFSKPIFTLALEDLWGALLDTPSPGSDEAPSIELESAPTLLSATPHPAEAPPDGPGPVDRQDVADINRSAEARFRHWFEGRGQDSVVGTQSVGQYVRMHGLEEGRVREWLVGLGVEPEVVTGEGAAPVPHPYTFARVEDWVRSVRRYLVQAPEWMDELLGAPVGTWRDAERGDARLTVDQVRALLRRVPDARELYSALADRFYPDLRGAPHVVGAALRAIRERAGIREEQVALLWGVTPAAVAELEVLPSLPESPVQWERYLRVLASLLPSRESWEMRLVGAVPSSPDRVDQSFPLGACLGALRVGAGITPLSVAEKMDVTTAEIERIESGVSELSAAVVEKYVRALAADTARFPEGYAHAGQYLEYVRQQSGATVAQAAEAHNAPGPHHAATMTAEMVRDRESGRVTPSVEIVGRYLENYTDGAVTVEECVESFPVIEAAPSRTPDEIAGYREPADKGSPDEPHTADARPAVKAEWEPLPPTGSAVLLAETKSLSETGDLVAAVVGRADEFGSLDRRVASILRHADHEVEVDTGGDRELVRVVAFREFVRKVDRSVAGRRRPRVAEVVVRLSRSTPTDDWEGEVVKVSQGRDKGLRTLAKVPDAQPSPTVAEQAVPAAVVAVGEALLPLGIEDLSVDVEIVANGEVARVPHGEEVKEVAVEQRISRVTMKHKDGSQARFAVQIDPVTRRLILYSPDDQVLLEQRIRAPVTAGPSTVERAVTMALGLAVQEFMRRNRGLGEISPDAPRFERDSDDDLVATQAALLDAVPLLVAEQLLAAKKVPQWQRRYLFDLRAGYLDRLGIGVRARGAEERTERTERYAALCAMAPGLEYVIEHHGSWLKRKRTPATETADAGLSVHLSMSMVASTSNAPAVIATDNPDQEQRYAVGSFTGSLGRGGANFFIMRDTARMHADPGPPHLKVRDELATHLFSHSSAAAVDVLARVGVDLLISGAGGAGGAGNMALLLEIAVRRSVGGVASGISSYLYYPSFNIPFLLYRQAMSVAGRGEALDEFTRLQKKSLLLYLGVDRLLDDHPDLPAEQLAQLADLLATEQDECRKMLAFIEEHRLEAGAFRTKAVPTIAPPLSKMLFSQMTPVAVAGGLGAAAAALAGHPELGVLGLPSNANRFFAALVRPIYDRNRRSAWARQKDGDNAYLFKRTDDALSEARARIAERLGVTVELPEPLPDAKRKMFSQIPGLTNGVSIAGLSLPISLLASRTPGLEELARGFLVSSGISPITNELYNAVKDFFYHKQSIKSEAIDERVALARGPDDLGEFISQLIELATTRSELEQRSAAAFDKDELPATSGDGLRGGTVSIAEVFEELTSKSSTVALERFQQVVAEKHTPELFDAFAESITPGFADLGAEFRVQNVANAFLRWHEADITAIGKLEVLDSYIAEHVTPAHGLTMLFPEEQRTVLNPAYVEFARAVTGLWFVSATEDAEEIDDVTGRFAAIAVHAAHAADESATPESAAADTDTVRARAQVFAQRLSASAQLIAGDIQRLAHGITLPELLTDTTPTGPWVEDSHHGAGIGTDGGPGIGANSLLVSRNNSETSGDRQQPGSWLTAMRDLRTALSGPEFRRKYGDRISRWLTETERPTGQWTGAADAATGSQNTHSPSRWRAYDGGKRREVPLSVAIGPAHPIDSPVRVGHTSLDPAKRSQPAREDGPGDPASPDGPDRTSSSNGTEDSV
ncbi:helix-turn-helix transcriptional regulator [Nocardia sp. NPDC004568]|uniref:helix-turn-helix transcriptional regulator n=1 Tax=Nocardia sp. NPDC004568 TaxID=3154551 RepID=UPI0033A56A03